MTDRPDDRSKGRAAETDDGEPPTVMGMLAARVRMTEGQLYTAILAVLLTFALMITGLPHAHKLPPDNAGLGGGTTQVAP